MKCKNKKITTLVLAFVLLFTLMPAQAVNAATTVTAPKIQFDIDGRDITATLTLDSIPTSFPLNQPSSLPYAAEYVWTIFFSDGTNLYDVGAMYFNGSNTNLSTGTIQTIPNNLWKFDGSSSYGVLNIGEVAKTINLNVKTTDTTITWNFTMPSEEPINLNNIQYLGYSIKDSHVTNEVKANYQITTNGPQLLGSEYMADYLFGFKVHYSSYGSTGGTSPTDSNRYKNGVKATVLGNTSNLKKTGYTFAGWNTKTDGTGTTYQAGSKATIGNVPLYLYPKWTKDATPTVTKVTVSPQTVSVQRGKTKQFTAAVTGTNSPAKTVKWKVTGAKKSGTKISANGLLTIAANETATKLTITATSTINSAKSGSTTVTVAKAKTPSLTTKEVPKNKTVKKGAKIVLKAPKNTVLYYTTNGKKPSTSTKTKTKAGGTVSIKISKKTTVRVIAVKSGYTTSNEVQRTYKVK